MNIEKDKFVCSKCGEFHPIETLVEFPLPYNISMVSSGQVPGNLKVMSKNSYVLNKSMYYLSNLEININDFHDTLEIWNWVYIDAAEVLKSFKFYKKGETTEIIMTGQMVYPIPFYNLVDKPVVKINITNDEFIPNVKLALSSSELYKDWKHGISKARLFKFLEYMNHV